MYYVSSRVVNELDIKICYQYVHVGSALIVSGLVPLA